MSQAFRENLLVQILGGILAWLVSSMLAQLDPFIERFGPATSMLIKLGLYGTAIIFGITFFYYFHVLGEADDGEGRYAHLRSDLGKGGKPARIYNDRLTHLLHELDRSIGDVEVPSRGIAARLFGPFPLWTAPAFNKCLLLALLYPVATIFLFWTISGQVGPAEASFGLHGDLSARQRTAALICLIVSAISYFNFRKQSSKGRWSWLWFCLLVVTGGLTAFAIVPSNGGAVGGAIGVSAAVIGAAGGDSGVAVIGAGIAAFAGALAYGALGPVGGVVAASGAAAITGLVLKDVPMARGRSGSFFIVATLLMVIACFGIARLLPSLPAWPVIGPLILFWGLLTLLDAPFLWFSFGLTRGLLRLGLKMQKWWPYGFALFDAAIAVLLIGVLAPVLLVGAQIFDHLAVQGEPAGTPILPLQEFFDNLRAQPSSPQHWWLYILLFSTMIPSVVNLALGVSR